jgi:regulatory protein
VIERLKESKLLDDARFAESFANARRERQGLGSRRVIQDLRQRRVAGQLAEKAVESAYQGADEGELVAQFLERKYRGTDLARHLKDPKNLAAAYRKLRYAGFGAGVSISVLRGYSAQASELEDTPEE